MSKKPEKDNLICPKHKKPMIYTHNFFNRTLHYCEDCLDDVFKNIVKMGEVLDKSKKPK